jgi:hypothetical protein
MHASRMRTRDADEIEELRVHGGLSPFELHLK